MGTLFSTPLFFFHMPPPEIEPNLERGLLHDFETEEGELDELAEPLAEEWPESECAADSLTDWLRGERNRVQLDSESRQSDPVKPSETGPSHDNILNHMRESLKPQAPKQPWETNSFLSYVLGGKSANLVTPKGPSVCRPLPWFWEGMGQQDDAMDLPPPVFKEHIFLKCTKWRLSMRWRLGVKHWRTSGPRSSSLTRTPSRSAGWSRPATESSHDSGCERV